MKTKHILTIIVAIFCGFINNASAQSAGPKKRTFTVPNLTNEEIIGRILRRNPDMDPRMIPVLEAAKAVFSGGIPTGDKDLFTDYASNCEIAFLMAQKVAEDTADIDPSRSGYAAQDAGALKAASIKFSELAGRQTSLSRELPATAPSAPASTPSPRKEIRPVRPAS